LTARADATKKALESQRTEKNGDKPGHLAHNLPRALRTVIMLTGGVDRKARGTEKAVWTHTRPSKTTYEPKRGYWFSSTRHFMAPCN